MISLLSMFHVICMFEFIMVTSVVENNVSLSLCLYPSLLTHSLSLSFSLSLLLPLSISPLYLFLDLPPSLSPHPPSSVGVRRKYRYIQTMNAPHLRVLSCYFPLISIVYNKFIKAKICAGMVYVLVHFL